MNEKRIREVIDIEEQADLLLTRAQREAERLPADAEREARELIEKVRAEARAEGQRIVEAARAEDAASAVISAAQQRMRESELLALSNMEKAVAYVLRKVTGRK